MNHDAEHYLSQLQSLLPPGRAWTREPGANLTALLAAWADEFGRVDLRIDQLLGEYDPRMAYELLGEWEAALGLPDPCSSAATSIAARQLNCWRKLAFVGGQTPQFYIDLAAALGFAIEIHEFDPNVDDWDASLTPLITDGRWRFVWRVHVLNAGDFTFFRFGDPFGGQFREGDIAIDLECIITAAKPAHTHVIFSYPES